MRSALLYMNFIVKKYEELTLDELYDIIKLRINVFVVEQNCPYYELDDKDKGAYHVFCVEDGRIIAYLRVLDRGISFDEVSLGRVISLKRRCGLGTKLLKAGISTAVEKYNADSIKIEAQSYAEKFYEGVGFVRVSDEFTEDGIPHILMKLDITE